MPLTLYILDTDDLRNCIDHGIPVNKCHPCKPGYLRWLGHLCAKEMQKPKPKTQVGISGKIYRECDFYEPRAVN